MRNWSTLRGNNRFDALALAIEPIEASVFFSDYWERKPLYLPRADEGRFDDLLRVDDVEHLICATGIRLPSFRLVKAGHELGPCDYTVSIPWRPQPFTGTADVLKVATEFHRGATIVLQSLQHQWPPLAHYCRALEAEVCHGVQANAYYTPRAAHGLSLHHDTHDVLVLQVAGLKRWVVNEPILELPLPGHPYSRHLGEPGEPVLDQVLSSGDTLYLPRGWLHQAKSLDVDSLHLTIGIKPYTWLHAVRAALELCAENDVEFRRAVPSDGTLVADLLERLGAHLEDKRVVSRMRQTLLSTQRPILEDQLSQMRMLDKMTMDTVVQRRVTVLAEAFEQDRRVILRFEGKTISFPASAYEAVKYCISTSRPFLPADLPGRLNFEGRLVLLRRLIVEGFLQAVIPQ